MICKALLSSSAHRSPGRRSTPVALLLASLVAVLVLGSCSSDSGDTSTEDSTGADDAAASSEGTVTVEHRFGATEVPVAPERIVSLDFQWTDVLTALGAPPAAHVPDPNIDGEAPWLDGQLDDTEVLEVTPTTSELPYEQIAALEPDLIVVTYLATDEQSYETLSAIAPTITTLAAGDGVDTWQDITETAGTVLGLEDEAAALVADVEGQVAALAEELPGLEGQTFALANYVPGDSIYVVADPTDGASVLFEQLGMAITPTILEKPNLEGGRVQLSFEQISLLDADLLLVLTHGADPDEITGYDALPAVERGAALAMDYADIVALNTPSPLSVPYVLEVIRPTLEAAEA